MAVVKADAYGHGLSCVVPALKEHVEWFGVANLREAQQVREFAPQNPILIMGPALPEERPWIVRGGFVPVVSNFEEAAAFASCSEVRPVPVHLAVDTGMGRVGVPLAEALELAKALQAVDGVELAGVGSHFPSADEDADATREQSLCFRNLVHELRARGYVRGPAHIANSAAVLGLPETAPDIYRTGLALYGCSPLPEFQSLLRPVMAWKTRVSLVRDIPAGWGISYGSTFVTPRPMRIATLAAGYADGYRRHLTGRGASVLLGGQRCPVLGRVTMDQIMVDAGAVPGAYAGSEVVLIGGQESEQITAAEIAALAGTIPWDVFTGIGPRVARIPGE